jgi:hypothetical protein
MTTAISSRCHGEVDRWRLRRSSRANSGPTQSSPRWARTNARFRCQAMSTVAQSSTRSEPSRRRSSTSNTHETTWSTKSWRRKFAARDSGRDAPRKVGSTAKPPVETDSLRTGYGNVALFLTLGNHVGLRRLPGGGRSRAKPVSTGLNSLLSREDAGNFADFGQFGQCGRRNPLFRRNKSCEFPATLSREFSHPIRWLAGISNRQAGNFRARKSVTSVRSRNRFLPLLARNTCQINGFHRRRVL